MQTWVIFKNNSHFSIPLKFQVIISFILKEQYVTFITVYGWFGLDCYGFIWIF